MERHQVVQFTRAWRPLLPLLPRRPQQTRRARRRARQTRRRPRPGLRPSTRHTASSSRGSGRARRPTLDMLLPVLRHLRPHPSYSLPTRRACTWTLGARHRVRRATHLRALLARLPPRQVLGPSINSRCSRASGSDHGRASQMPASEENPRAADGLTMATVPAGRLPPMSAKARMDPSRSQSLRAGQLQSPIVSSLRCPGQPVHRPRQRPVAPRRRQRPAIRAALSSHLALHRPLAARPLLRHHLLRRARIQTRPMSASCPSYLYKACPSHPSDTLSTRIASWPPSSAQASSTGQPQRRSCGARRRS